MLRHNSQVMIAAALLLAASTAWAQGLSTQEVGTAATITNLEGPTVDAEGNVYFTDLGSDSNRILKLGTDGRVSTFRQPANRPNGLVFDTQFRLIAAEGGDPDSKTPPRITRTDMKTGRIEVLAEKYEGASFGGPNDVTFDGQGRIYFSAGGNVYRVDNAGKVVRVLTARAANGVMLSLDDRTLYVTEADRAVDGPRRVSAFDLSADGATASNPRMLRDFYNGRGADGLAIDVEGNLYVAAGMDRLRGTIETLATRNGVYVFSAKGTLIDFVSIPLSNITNLAFGGPDLRTVYVTSGHTVFTFQTKVAGTRR